MQDVGHSFIIIKDFLYDAIYRMLYILVVS